MPLIAPLGAIGIGLLFLVLFMEWVYFEAISITHGNFRTGYLITIFVATIVSFILITLDHGLLTALVCIIIAYRRLWLIKSDEKSLERNFLRGTSVYLLFVGLLPLLYSILTTFTAR